MQTSEENKMSYQCLCTKAAIGGLPVECFIAPGQYFQKNLHFSEEHAHASFELLICKSGSGFQFINGKGHRYGVNTVFIFAPFISHAHICDSNTHELRYSIKLEVPNQKEEEPSFSIDPAAGIAFKYLNTNGYFQTTADDNLILVIDMLIDTLKQDNPFKELLLGGILSMILTNVCKEINIVAGESLRDKGRSSSAGSLNERKFQIDLFFDHLMDGDAHMEDLCLLVHLSPSQLNRVIKELYGTTFKQKLIDVRIAYIKYFLKYLDLSIDEIAAKTNFSTGSSLSLFFKQHSGMAPGQYRRKERV
jgi:AraC-type DNA-binding domain-containing proteins